MTKAKPKTKAPVKGPIPNTASLNREVWLHKALTQFRKWFIQEDQPLPSHIRLSCGYPLGKRTAGGECWSDRCSDDGAREIFLSPRNDDPIHVLDILLHELVHAALPSGEGHGKNFRKLAISLGLTGKMRSTVPTPELRERLATMIEKLGPYPHASLTLNGKGEGGVGGGPGDVGGPGGRKKQTARQLKTQCPTCGYLARVSKKWLEEAGPPICPTDNIPLQAA